MTTNKKIINFYSFIKKSKELVELKETISNDFESLVFDKYPEIKDIKESLYEFGADFCLLSGSGSTIYGIFKRRELAVKAAGNFRSEYTMIITQPRTE